MGNHTLSARLVRKPQSTPETQPEYPESASRRRLIRIALQGATLPALCSLLGGTPGRVWGAAAGFLAPSGMPAGSAYAAFGTAGQVVRDFNDPYIELLRLLHVAAEIEHALMNQYLYASFSVKPVYQAIAGHGAPSSNDLLGVAIQEMQHLGKVNQLLVALGAAPTLIREDFPYEPDIYPFRFNLEPLSRASLAKYVWTEAPVGATDVGKAKTAADRSFCLELKRALGKGARPNRVGSLYDAVIAAAAELDAAKDKSLPSLEPWIRTLHDIKLQGELAHFQFFKRVFIGTHEGFGGRGDVWARPVADPLYPANQVPVNPTAYVGHDHQIPDLQTRGLAWLGDLHYWILLILLSAGYSHGSTEHIALARAHMMGPFWSLARKLAGMGSGMPFDPLSLGYAPGVTREGNSRLLSRLLGEADKFEKRLGAVLPSDYPVDCCRGTQQALSQLEGKVQSGRAPTQPWDDGLAEKRGQRTLTVG
jgi:hypothetical protein